MTYEQVKNRVLQLLNQYTVAGTHVPSSYNNQQDYLNRIPDLVNDAMMEIATTVRKIPALLHLNIDDEYTEFGDLVQFELPEDFYQFKTGDTLLMTEDGHVFHTNRYAIQGRNYLLIPRRELEKGRTYTLTYYRYPIPADLTSTDPLDNVPETHEAIPYYVAAFIVIHDDSFLYASFYNKYEDKLSKMSPDISAEVHSVGDVYNFDSGYVYWS
jgi:hypothetical protein